MLRAGLARSVWGSNSKTLSQRAARDRKEKSHWSNRRFVLCCSSLLAGLQEQEPAAVFRVTKLRATTPPPPRRRPNKTTPTQVGEVVSNKNKTRALIIFKWPLSLSLSLFFALCPAQRKKRTRPLKSAAPRVNYVPLSSRTSIGDEKNRASSVCTRAGDDHCTRGWASERAKLIHLVFREAALAQVYNS